MRKTPPDILITTPESLYLMISSGAREILDRRRGGDRGRDPRGRALEARLAPGADRWSGSTTCRRATTARFSGSASRPPSGRWSGSASSSSGAGASATIVDASKPKELDLEIVVPVEDMTEPDAHVEKRRDGGDSGLTHPPA